MSKENILQEYLRRAKLTGLTSNKLTGGEYSLCLMSGDINSELAVVGEAVGDREIQLSMPFVGDAGQKLWSVLSKYDINRTQCYVTNVIKRQMSTLKFGNRKPISRLELEHWEQLLNWELDQLPNLKYILCLGDVALNAIVGVDGITNWRGSVVDCKVGHLRRDVQVICSFNPAHINREPKWAAIFKFDLYKLHLVLEGRYSKYRIEPIINPTFNQAMRFIDDIQAQQKPISFDIEGIGGETACIGFANDPHTGMCINFRDQQQSSRFSIKEEAAIRLRIDRLFQDKKIQFIAQNGNFDGYWLGYKDCIHARCDFDTLLAHHTLYPRMPHGLGFLTAQYTTHPYYKDEGKEWKERGEINEFWEYNVKDCCLTLYIAERLKEELKHHKLEEFFHNHVMRLQPHLTKMTVTGIKADTSLKDAVAEGLKEDLDKKLVEFHAAIKASTGEDDLKPNPASAPQMAKLYFDKMKLRGHGRSTGKANVSKIRSSIETSATDLAVINAAETWKKDKKFLSTYANFKLDDDNRIRCEWKQYGVQKAPGRLSSARTLWDSGMNMQNQPERAYPMFIADEGYVFTYFDLVQAEAKVVAWLWNVQALKDAFIKAMTDPSVDVHRLNGARIFNCPYEEIPSEDRDSLGNHTRRYIAKRCVHGLNYRMMPDKLAEVTGLPLNLAFEAHAAYHRAFPEVRKGWEETIKEVRETKMLFNLLGRRLLYVEPLTEEAMESIIAFKPQSTIGDLVNKVIYLSHEDPKWPKDALIKLNNHDALMALHKPEDKEKVTEIMRKHAEEPLIIHGEPVKIFTEFMYSTPDEKGVHRWSTLN